MGVKQTEALKLARDVMKHTRNCLYQSLAQDDVVCDCGVTMARAAIDEALDEQPAQQLKTAQQSVAFSQFLSDVVTAAGLLEHGKTDKGLAKRISEFTFRLRTSPQPASKPWAGLTNSDKLDLISAAKGIGGRIQGDGQLLALLDDHEAKLREKNA